MPANSKHLPLTTRRGVTSLPLDPPPFFLEREIRLPWKGLGVYSTCVGLAVLCGFRLFFPGIHTPLPSLISLIVVSAGSAGFYHGVRLLAYWLVWAWVLRRYPLSGGIHPAARGELPCSAFLLVLLSPCLGFVPLCAAMYGSLGGFRPELWLCAAVGAALSVKDLRAVRHLLFIDRSRWLKETVSGMDVLKLVDSA
ncbi:MAG: hypothetical protein V1792_27750 [Pseudomonadota bacterium]